jgi:hypothetical protein
MAALGEMSKQPLSVDCVVTQGFVTTINKLGIQMLGQLHEY